MPPAVKFQLSTVLRLAQLRGGITLASPMKISKLLALAALLSVASIRAKEPAATARDDASQSAYSGGWTESTGGTGFGNWQFQDFHGTNDSYAGHFIANHSDNHEIDPIASGGSAFGLYANGGEFEVAAAFRSFAAPLRVGDAFSFQMLNGLIEQKGTTDSPAAGAIGLTLRNGNAAGTPDDYNKGARFEIINLKGQANYQVYDGEASHDTGVVFSDQGVAVTVTLTGADTYDLEITRLADKQTTRLTGRKLGGSGPIESFCIFDRNGEKADGFFNNFQVGATGK